MMTLDQLQRVREEIGRLEDRIVELTSAELVYQKWESKRSGSHPGPRPLSGSRESGAVRRASMDLSRELAELRKYS